MANTKSKATNKAEITKKIDNEEKQQEENKTKPIEWKNLDQYIGKPVWDNKKKKWRILEGYMRVNKTYSMTFTDMSDWDDCDSDRIYLEEVK